MNQFRELDRSGKTRIIVFIVLMAAAAFGVMISSEIIAAVAQYLDAYAEQNKNSSVYVDGADISWLMTVFSGIGYLGGMLLGVFFTGVMMLFNAAAMGIFRLVAFRTVMEVQETEYLLGQKLQFFLCITVAAIAFVTIGVQSLAWGLFGFIFCVPMGLFGWLFYLLPLKNRLHVPETKTDVTEV